MGYEFHFLFIVALKILYKIWIDNQIKEKNKKLKYKVSTSSDREPNDSCKGSHTLAVSNTAHGNGFGGAESEE